MRTSRRIPVLLFVLLAVTTLNTLTIIPARADEPSPVPKTQPADQELTLKVGLYENAPKIYTDQNSQPAGFWPDLLHYIAAEEGWQIEWVSGTWDDGLDRLEKGEIDIMPDTGWTEPRSKRFDFSQETVLLSWSRLYARKGTDIQSILDLEGKTIAALEGSFNLEGPEGIRELTQEFEIESTLLGMDDYVQVFEALERGDIDAGVTNKDFGNRHEGAYNIERTAIIFQPARMLFAFTKDAELTPYLIERIDDHVRTLRADNGSIYYQALEEHIGGKGAETFIETIPGWIKNVLIGSAGLIVFLLVVGAVSRLQVRRRTAELRTSEARNRDLLESIPDLIFKLNHRGEYLDYQAKDESMLYAPPETFLGKKVDQVLPPEVAAEMLKNQQRALKSGEMQKYEYVLPMEGDQHHYEARYIPTGKDEVIAIVRDITEQVQTEKALQESEQQLTLIYDAVGDMIYSLAVEPGDCYRFQSVNQAFLEATGLTRDQVIGKLVEEVIPEPSLAMVLGNYKKAIEENRIIRWEETSRYPAGVKVGDVSIAPIFDDHGICTHLVGSVHDITERVRVQEALRKSEENFRNIFQFVPESLLAVDNQIEVLDSNKAFVELIRKYAPELNMSEDELREIILSELRNRFGKTEHGIIEIGENPES